MLRVIASVFNCKDITIIGREYLFPNLKCGEMGELGIWMVGFDSLKEFLQSVQSQTYEWEDRGLSGRDICMSWLWLTALTIWGLGWKVLEWEENIRRLRKTKKQHLACVIFLLPASSHLRAAGIAAAEVVLWE